MAWRAVKAVLPTSERTVWLLVDEVFEVHPEGREFVLWMLARNFSTETIRAYVPRVGRLLTWCEDNGVEWRRVRLGDLTRFKFFLEESPDRRGARRSGKAVNAVLIAAVTFLRFCASHGYVNQTMVDQLHERRFLRFAPAGYNRGEDGQYSIVRSPVLRSSEQLLPPALLDADQARTLVRMARSSRDRFLILLLLESGVRIGEALGMRREDLHLLPTSQALGCMVAGPHFHVRPRQNANGARVKSGRPRTIPVTDALVRAFRDYVVVRDQDPVAEGCDYLFVNLTGGFRGRPMSYSNAKQMIEAAGRRGGFRVRPHMLRHTAATRWLRGGADPDVVQVLLGHASRSSMAVYLHATDDDLRAAVERCAG